MSSVWIVELKLRPKQEWEIYSYLVCENEKEAKIKITELYNCFPERFYRVAEYRRVEPKLKAQHKAVARRQAAKK